MSENKWPNSITEQDDKSFSFNMELGRITKLEDTKFNGVHPNGIDKGYVAQGNFSISPTVGECFYIGTLRTSPVTEIVSQTDTEMVFKTLNSIYKLEILKRLKVK